MHSVLSHSPLHFYSLVCVAIVTYLLKVFGNDLDDADAFIERHNANKGA